MSGAGIHGDLTAAAYHADPCETPSLTASIAHLLYSRSPLHAWTAHPQLNPDYEPEEAERFDVGTAAHALLLQGEDIVHVIDAPDWRTTAAREARSDARAAGLLPLLAGHWERVQAMVASVTEQLSRLEADPPLFRDGQPERTLIWEEDGVLCRARLDWLRSDHKAIDDFKTTSRSAHPGTWTRTTLWSIGADVQVAFYLRGLKALTGAEAEFRFCVAECDPPYALSVIELGPSALELANHKIDSARTAWKRCLESGEWPAYAPRVCYADAPPWQESEWLEREAQEEALA